MTSAVLSPQDEGYRVYMVIFNKILWLMMFLGLWAPKGGGWRLWCLRHLYPIFIYIMILYPWTTFLTQEAYWSVPVFLFINLHISGIFAYRSAKKYWKKNHLVDFITSTFIPFYDDFTEFERRHRAVSLDMTSDQHSLRENSEHRTLQKGFEQRRRMESRERDRMANVKYTEYSQYPYGHMHRRRGSSNDVDLHKSLQRLRRETTDPFRQREENITSWANIAGSENKLSLSLFYEG